VERLPRRGGAGRAHYPDTPQSSIMAQARLARRGEHRTPFTGWRASSERAMLGKEVLWDLNHRLFLRKASANES
jgi:hypothetical protein